MCEPPHIDGICIILIYFLRYWDHVGGESLDAALAAAAPFARFIVSSLYLKENTKTPKLNCDPQIVGLISGYNSQHAPLKVFVKLLETGTKIG